VAQGPTGGVMGGGLIAPRYRCNRVCRRISAEQVRQKVEIKPFQLA
jgi:hypothetical protein